MKYIYITYLYIIYNIYMLYIIYIKQNTYMYVKCAFDTKRNFTKLNCVN